MNLPQQSITLKMIIDSGLIQPEALLISKLKQDITGILNADGSISLNLKGQIKNFFSPSGAARAIEKRSINGWIYWIIKESGVPKELAIFREEYKKIKK